MKRKRFTEEQIIGVLKESEAGAKTDDICRRHGISTATFYTWRKKYGGMDASEAQRLRELEIENAKLKRIVADQMLDMSSMITAGSVLARSSMYRSPEHALHGTLMTWRYALACLRRSSWTTAQKAPARRCSTGRNEPACGCASSNRANPSRTPSWRVSTASSGMNA